MKKKRQQAIIELIAKQPVETQEELTSLLGYQGTGAYEDSSAGRKAGIRAFECQGKRSGKVLSENFK